jgi:hypothetical protein
MISSKVFDQVEMVFRHLKDQTKLFGGTQVVLSGDFFQLKPVANDLYQDKGDYIFTSEIFKAMKFHHITFTNVYRQDESSLVKAVSELCTGNISDETDDLIKNHLDRNIPDGTDPVELYALNYDVEVANSRHLLQMPGKY